MAVDSYGNNNEPLFDGTKASNLAADLNAISSYAVKVGNRKVGSAAARRALTGQDVWDGLAYFETDSGDTYVYDASANAWNYWIQSGNTATSGYFTPASGWGMSYGGNSGVQYSTVGANVVQTYVSFFRTASSSISVPSDGNISNVTVGHVSIAPASIIALPSGASGRIAHFTIDSDGSVSLVAVSPGSNIGQGDHLSFSGLYLFR